MTTPDPDSPLVADEEANAPATDLLAFADGSARWRRAGRRFAREARATGWFRKVRVFDAAGLQERYPEFFTSRADIFDHPTPGFGYWSWKAFLLRRHIEENLHWGGGRVLYLDVGSHFNVGSASSVRMRTYEDLADKNGALFMHMPHLPEQEWTKPEVLRHFALTDEQASTGQLLGGLLLLPIRPDALELCRAWEEATLLERHRLLLDPMTDEDRGPHLKAHRHDQSILSCLAKSRELPSIPDETYFAPEWRTGGRDFPIWTVRNRSGVRFSSNRAWFKAKKVAERGCLAITSRS